MLDTLVINKGVVRTLSLNISNLEKLRNSENKQIDGLYIKIENDEVLNVATDSFYMHKTSARLSSVCNDNSIIGVSGEVIIPFESLRRYFKLADLTSDSDWVFINKVAWEHWCRLSKMPAYISGHYVDYHKPDRLDFQKTGLKLYRWIIDTINTHSIAFDSYYFYKYKKTKEVFLFGVVKGDYRFKITRLSYVGRLTEKIKIKDCFLMTGHLVGFSGKDAEVEICDRAFNFQMKDTNNDTHSNVFSIFKIYSKDDKKTIKRMCKDLIGG